MAEAPVKGREKPSVVIAIPPSKAPTATAQGGGRSSQAEGQREARRFAKESADQRAAAEWLDTISHHHLLDLQEQWWKNYSAAEESLATDGPVVQIPMMVTRVQFILLLKSVPKLPQSLMESWFDALALRFAHVTPPPAEITLDFRRILAASALVSFGLKSQEEHNLGDEYNFAEDDDAAGSLGAVGGRSWMVRVLYELYSCHGPSGGCSLEDGVSINYAGLAKVVETVVSLPILLAAAINNGSGNPRLRSCPDPALYPAQIPFDMLSEGETNPVVHRLWGGRDINSQLTLDEFADALSEMELPAGDDGALWESRPVGPQQGIPFLSVNNRTIVPESSKSTRGGSWLFVVKDDIVLRQLEVGLRKGLCKHVVQEGARVLVEVFACEEGLPAFSAEAEASDRTILEHSNNYRCWWPQLQERPVTFVGGIRVVFSIVGGANAQHMMGQQVMGHARGDDSFGDKGDGHARKEDRESGDEAHLHGEEVAGETDEGTSASETKSEIKDLRIRAEDIPARGVGEGASPEPREALRSEPRQETCHASSQGVMGHAGSARVVGWPMLHAGESCVGSSRPSTPNTFGTLLAKRRSDDRSCALKISSPKISSPSFTPVLSPVSLGPSRMPWKLASHTVKLNRYQGTVEGFETLWKGTRGSLEGAAGACSGTWSSPHTPRSLQPLTPRGGSPLPLDSPSLRCSGSPTNIGEPAFALAAKPLEALNHQKVCSELSSASPLLRFRSNEYKLFEMRSAPNQLLEALRFFELPLPEKHKAAFSWGSQQQDRLLLLARYIDMVARNVRKLCLAEPRCVHVHAPCYILGDIHGNYQDLIAFEKALWRIGLGLNPANFLFLGDYVDRGPHSLEVIMYLLAQKALCPGKIVLLRGNHEIRAQNSHKGYNPCFKQSCEDRLGPELGAQVWESINLVFDTLPVAAIVDNNIFCVHGGIPSTEVLVRSTDKFGRRGGIAALSAEINKIPRDLPNPDPAEGGDKLAWDLMWNDPAPSSGSVKEQENEFSENQARGTGHFFSAHGLEKFLRHYGLSYLVRAHEVRKTGFQVQQHSQMVTIFSSSGYCGANNEACCILACEGKLRFIRLEHSLLPQLGSLASKVAAASAMVAALAAGVQIPQEHLVRNAGSRNQGEQARDHGGAGAGAEDGDDSGPGAHSEDSADMAAAAALAAAAVDNSKLRTNGHCAERERVSTEGINDALLNPHRMLQQRIQRRLQERMADVKSLSPPHAAAACAMSGDDVDDVDDEVDEEAGGEQVDKGGSACAERKPGADVEKSTVRSGARRKRGEEEVGSAPKFPRGSCSPADCGRGRCLEEGGEKAASAKSPEVQDERGRRSRRRSGRTIKTPA